MFSVDLHVQADLYAVVGRNAKPEIAQHTGRHREPSLERTDKPCKNDDTRAGEGMVTSRAEERPPARAQQQTHAP